MRLLTALCLFLGSTWAALNIENMPYFDFKTQSCAGVQAPAGLLMISKPVVYDGELYVMSMLTYQVMKISESEDGVRTCSSIGGIPSGPGGVIGGFSLGLEVDPSGNFYITHTGLGAPTNDWGSIWKIPFDAPRPAGAQRIHRSTQPNGLPSGVAVDWRHNSLLYTSESDGTIYRLRLLDNTVSVWATGVDFAGTGRTPGVSPDASIENTNLLGIPIGPAGITISVNGKTAYVAVGEPGRVLAIDIDGETGDAVSHRQVASVPEYTTEGVAVSANEKTLIFTTVFANGTNLTPDSPSGEYQGGVLPGRSVWETDLTTGVTSRVFDERLGCPTGITSAKGVLPGGSGRYFISASGLDSLPFWFLGLIRNNVVRAPYSSAFVNSTGVAFPDAVYNVMVLVATVV